MHENKAEVDVNRPLDKVSDLEGKTQRAYELAEMTATQCGRLSRVLVLLRGNLPQEAEEKHDGEVSSANLLERLNTAQNHQRTSLDSMQNMLGELENLI